MLTPLLDSTPNIKPYPNIQSISVIFTPLFYLLFFRNLLNPLYLSMSQPVPSGPHLKIKGKILNIWGLFYALTTFTVALGVCLWERGRVCVYVFMSVCVYV